MKPELVDRDRSNLERGNNKSDEVAILAGSSRCSPGRRYRGLKADIRHHGRNYGSWSKHLVTSEEISDSVCFPFPINESCRGLIFISERVRELWYHGYDHYMKYGEFSHLWISVIAMI